MDLAGLAADLRDLGADLAGKTLPAAGAEAGAETATQILRGDLPSGRFSNLNGGTTLTVTAEPAAVVLAPASAWGLLDAGARRHRIGGQRQRLRVGAGVRMGPVDHPGTGGKGTLGRVDAELPDAVAEGVDEAVDKMLAGW